MRAVPRVYLDEGGHTSVYSDPLPDTSDSLPKSTYLQ